MKPLFGIITYIGTLVRKAPYAYPAGIILLFCFFPFRPTFGQTSIIGIRVNDRVVVGADSTSVRSDTMTRTEESYCKIGVGDGFFFALAGLYHNVETAFNPYMIIRDSSNLGLTIEKKVKRLEEMIEKPLTEILERLRRDSPLEYARRYQGGSALQIIFFGVEEGSTFMLAREFVPTATILFPVQIIIFRYKCPGDCENGEEIYKLGESEAIDRFLIKEPDFWKNNPVDAIRKLIELEIADRPLNVGPPIDILQIDKNGARWIQKKKECSDIQ